MHSIIKSIITSTSNNYKEIFPLFLEILSFRTLYSFDSNSRLATWDIGIFSILWDHLVDVLLLPGTRKERRKKNWTLIILSILQVDALWRLFPRHQKFQYELLMKCKFNIYICPHYSPSVYCASKTLIHLRSSENIRRYTGLTKKSYGICLYWIFFARQYMLRGNHCTRDGDCVVL